MVDAFRSCVTGPEHKCANQCGNNQPRVRKDSGTEGHSAVLKSEDLRKVGRIRIVLTPRVREAERGEPSRLVRRSKGRVFVGVVGQ